MLQSKSSVCVILTGLLTFFSQTAFGLSAFPGAEGFGCEAVGGRGGTVYHVTNLNDAGPGSFRDAVSQSGRTVVFDVSGVIPIKDRIVVKDHITIAGQTAPGDGVVIYGNGLSFSSADHAIVRFMRFRMGAGGSKGKDAVGIAKGTPMIFDHCSVSWGRDETFSINGEDGFYTIQDSIIAQGLHSHSCGGLLQNWGGISILRCLYIDNHTRNPKVKGVNQFVNNVIYNWRAAGYILGDSAGQSHANIMNNYYISGPETPDRSPFTRGNENFHVFAENNYYDANQNGVLDGIVLDRSDYGVVSWQQKAYDYPMIRTVYNPQAAYKIVVSQAGASLPNRDSVDRLLMKELQSLGKHGKVISNENQLSTRGPGKLRPGTCPEDTDQDGMADFWEQSVAGLDPEKADHNGDVDGNGYTNLEDYLNWLAGPHVRVSQNGQVEIDLSDYTAGFGDKAVYTVGNCNRLAAKMLDDGHTVHLMPEQDYVGLGKFEFAVGDGDQMSVTVSVLVSEQGDQ